ncbi:DUF2059 domain-containing protein [Novosphingobium sp. BL-8H]|uniref:DUF2059 domain-containing protein n=1 Tax=Novosphingobium sp. BL-8H TaxID=3127640 RepID=UPI0037579D27
MFRASCAAAVLGLSALAIAAPAQAQSAPSPANSQPVDQGRLAVAHDIVTLAWPPEQRDAMMQKLLTVISAQFKSGAPIDTIHDAGLRQIMNDYFNSIPELLKPAVSAFLPKQMDAIAKAYARKFTLTELQDVRTFAQTPSGSRFLQQSMEVMSDPDVAAVNTAYFKDVTVLSQQISLDLKTKVEAYLKTHPQAVPKS